MPSGWVSEGGLGDYPPNNVRMAEHGMFRDFLDIFEFGLENIVVLVLQEAHERLR